ncbi:MAG: hypothetical protein IKI64_04465 [Clostridia bacterium]|nr:hypothetical protein [Clostridia bacterium]
MNAATDLDNYRSVVKDDFIWLYIFGKQRPDFDNIQSYYRYINNTINLSFIYAYSCIKEMLNVEEDIEEKKKSFNPNAKRAIKNIDRIYNNLDISFELITYIMLDVQFDLALGRESCLNKYVSGISADFNVLDYSPRILHWMSTSKAEKDVTLTDMIALFRKLLKSLPFIGNTALRGEKHETFFEIEETFEKKIVYTDHRLYIHDCGRGYYQFYFLERVDAKTHSLSLCYSTPDYADKYMIVYHADALPEILESDDCEHIISDVEGIESICSIITGTNAKEVLNSRGRLADGISNIYTVNYKYLKNLSLSISDELGRSDNTLFRNQVLQKYGINPGKEYDLDSVIIMQLIERSPSNVLFDLFCIDPSAFHSIIKNLYSRFNCKLRFKYIDFSRSPVDYSELDQHLIRNRRTNYGAYQGMELAEMQANYILSTLLANSRESEARVFRVSDVIEDINNDRSLDAAQDACAQLLIKTCCFYRGVIAYGYEKIEYDADCYDSMPSAETIKETQKRFQKAFLEAAESAYKNDYLCHQTGNSGDNLAFAIDAFVRFIDQVDNSIELRKALKCVLGRNSVIDKRQLSLSSDIVLLEREEQTKQLLGILEFLTTGSFEKNESKGDFNSSVYPITGRYVSNSESNDQCRIANFSIRIDVNANGQFDYMKTINILTEFYYQIDEYYYCLPNIGRSNYEWWIDPLIVSATDFDSIFDKKE